MEQQQVELLLQRQHEGMIVIPSSQQTSHFQRIHEVKVPLVSIDRPLGPVLSDVLVVDNRRATILAIQHLQQHDHRHILFVTDEHQAYTNAERLAGYQQAVREAGLPTSVCVLGDVSGSARDQLTRLMIGSPAITAVFAANDLLTIETFNELQRLGKRIPEDIDLVGFDDFQAASMVTPAITVISQPIAALGRAAVERLLSRIEHGPAEPPPGVVRESCGRSRETGTRPAPDARKGAGRCGRGTASCAPCLPPALWIHRRWRGASSILSANRTTLRTSQKKASCC